MSLKLYLGLFVGIGLGSIVANITIHKLFGKSNIPQTNFNNKKALQQNNINKSSENMYDSISKGLDESSLSNSNKKT